jgi:zinc/manganese transport system permease protein
MNILRLMFLPFMECIILVGIHSYLGLHVLRRQIIFVDLSIAQMAGLGTAAAILAGFHPGSAPSYLYSLSFAFLGAILFSATRFKRHQEIPQEAVIGLVYAVAAAVAFLLLDRAATGSEHMKDIISGNLLWVRKAEVVKAAVIYAVIGGIHVLFKDKFYRVSTDPEGARNEGMNIFFWDLLFYATFAVVITTSVEVAGVLLVFTFLVTPAIMAMLTTADFSKQLIFGWVTGTIVSLVGLGLSYALDFPSGPAVVVTYAVALVLWGAVLNIREEKRLFPCTRRVCLSGVGLGVFLLWLWLLKEIFHGHTH